MDEELDKDLIDQIEHIMDEQELFEKRRVELEAKVPEMKTGEEYVDPDTGIVVSKYGVGRTATGRFAVGHKSPGRPTKDEELRRLEHDFYETLKRLTTPEQFEKVINSLVARAQRGSYQHIKLLFEYLLGAPEQYIKIDNRNIPDLIEFDAHFPEDDTVAPGMWSDEE